MAMSGRDETRGRLTVKPSMPVQILAPGVYKIPQQSGSNALLHVPDAAKSKAVALLVILHGAGGKAEHGLPILRGLADKYGVAVLSPGSAGRTWDAVLGEFGADVANLNGTLASVFKHVNIDPHRIAIGGFSDGGSYALSLGLTNGDLFTHIIAYSPGYAFPAKSRGDPYIFISHGDRDSVLPIDRCSYKVLENLKRWNRTHVQFREFHGDHCVPSAVVNESLTWLTQQSNN